MEQQRLAEMGRARDLRSHGHGQADSPDLDDDGVLIDVHDGAAD
jgi:hypothetical protein